MPLDDVALAPGDAAVTDLDRRREGPGSDAAVDGRDLEAGHVLNLVSTEQALSGSCMTLHVTSCHVLAQRFIRVAETRLFKKADALPNELPNCLPSVGPVDGLGGRPEGSVAVTVDEWPCPRCRDPLLTWRRSCPSHGPSLSDQSTTGSGPGAFVDREAACIRARATLPCRPETPRVLFVGIPLRSRKKSAGSPRTSRSTARACARRRRQRWVQ